MRLVERLEPDGGLPLGVLLGELGAGEAQQEHGRVAQDARQAGQEVEQSWLGPVDVVHEDAERSLSRSRGDQRVQGRGDLFGRGLSFGQADRLRDDRSVSLGKDCGGRPCASSRECSSRMPTA